MRPRIGRDLFEHPRLHHELPGHLAALGLDPVARAAGFRAFTPPLAGTENVLLVQEEPPLSIDSPAQTKTTHLRLV